MLKWDGTQFPENVSIKDGFIFVDGIFSCKAIKITKGDKIVYHFIDQIRPFFGLKERGTHLFGEHFYVNPLLPENKMTIYDAREEIAFREILGLTTCSRSAIYEDENGNIFSTDYGNLKKVSRDERKIKKKAVHSFFDSYEIFFTVLRRMIIIFDSQTIEFNVFVPKNFFWIRNQIISRVFSLKDSADAFLE